jgi:hypothetical protein
LILNFLQSRHFSHKKKKSFSIQVFRRFQWNLIRLEYEHTHNAEHYRAVRDVPVPQILDAPVELFEDSATVRRSEDSMDDEINLSDVEESNINRRATMPDVELHRTSMSMRKRSNSSLSDESKRRDDVDTESGSFPRVPNSSQQFRRHSEREVVSRRWSRTMGASRSHTVLLLGSKNRNIPPN